MTMRYTDMPGNEARQILDAVNKHGLDRVESDAKDSIQATLMIDLDLALTDPAKARAEHMACDFES